jgi:hypothetical protein
MCMDNQQLPRLLADQASHITESFTVGYLVYSTAESSVPIFLGLRRRNDAIFEFVSPARAREVII